MPNVVILGGNGYLGRNITKVWLAIDPKLEFYIVSRSGQNKLVDKRIHNIKADVTNEKDVAKKLPDTFDYIIDCIGAHEKDPEKFKQINDLPAETMLALARKQKDPVMGFISGRLGPKTFIDGKAQILKELQDSSIKVASVSPSVVYGNGRKDSMTKMVPFLKFMGLFSAKMNPDDVNDVVKDLINQMIKLLNS